MSLWGSLRSRVKKKGSAGGSDDFTGQELPGKGDEKDDEINESGQPQTNSPASSPNIEATDTDSSPGSSEANSRSSILKDGTLSKLGEVRKSWKKRYFTLTQTTLDYYKTTSGTGSASTPTQTLSRSKSQSSSRQNTTKPVGSILLYNCTVDKAESDTNKKFSFKIEHPTRRTYYVLCETEEEMQDWISAIQKVLADLDKRKTKPRVGSLIDEYSDTNKYEIVYDMLTGIRHTVSKHSAKPPRSIYEQDFEESIKYPIRRERGRNHTPGSKYDFDFTDYAPQVFLSLREKYGIDPADYLLSLTADYMLAELPTPGKSGSLFYFSYDLKFLIKTVTYGEFRCLRNILPNYYLHVVQNPNTLLTKFCGLHKVSLRLNKSFYFVVMTNVFATDKQIHERYDLKGSTVGRSATPAEKARGGAVLKDLDFTSMIYLGPQKRTLLSNQLESDARFLEKIKIMDYSLLLGVHYEDKPAPADAFRARRSVSKAELVLPRSKLRESGNIPHASITPTEINVTNDNDSAEDEPELQLTPVQESDLPVTKPGNYISAFQQDVGGFRSTNKQDKPCNVLYFIGIIDILQSYTVKKQIEHQYKATKYDQKEISVVEPSQYATRFLKFMFSKIGWEDDVNNNNSTPSSAHNSSRSVTSNSSSGSLPTSPAPTTGSDSSPGSRKNSTSGTPSSPAPDQPSPKSTPASSSPSPDGEQISTV